MGGPRQVGRALGMVPKLGLVGLRFAPSNNGWLKKLKNSARNSSVSRSRIGIFLITEKSTLLVLSERRLLKRGGKIRRLSESWSFELQSRGVVLNAWLRLCGGFTK